jgi:simple sugar transport system substrate-binding protein
MNATIAQFPGRMASLAVDAAVRAVQGKQVDTFIDTGTELVTTANASKFLQFQ